MLDRLRRHLYYESGSKRVKAAIEEYGLRSQFLKINNNFKKLGTHRKAGQPVYPLIGIPACLNPI